MVLFVVLLVLAQVIRLTIPWFFGQAVNALQKSGMEGIAEAVRKIQAYAGELARA